MKDKNYIVIQGWMINRLNLKSNDLILYAIIFGFSQDSSSKFTGSLKYLQETTGVSRNTVLKSLSKLIELGYIIKEEEVLNNVKFCHYSHNEQGVQFLTLGGAVSDIGGSETALGGGSETAPYNTINNNTIIKQSNKEGVEIKDSKQSNSDEVDLFSKSEEEKEKKVPLKKEKLSNEVIFPIVKKLSSYFPEDITKRLSRNDKLKWSETVEKLIRLDEYTKEQIERAVEIGRKDNFWKNNFLSITKLRKKDKQDVKYIQVFLNLDPEKKDDTGDGNYEHKPTEKPKWI